MSLEDVKRFYERLGTDEEFRTQVQGAKNKQEYSRIVKASGYDFTVAEFEEHTLNLLESASDEGELKDLDERELEAIFGGATNFLISDKPVIAIPKYGAPPYPGSILPPDDYYPQDNPPPHPRPRRYPWKLNPKV
jgi:predicted ribosomally synthesized peptide with nif11-like leader